ncbi:hypothetical protein ACFU53_22665 [Streptomyces sp. NPDC057474]|uniref:hypothetical protein n=1 Tax=Streptomyces sp. NPDC057474 TaxID=3346144 RepID=UPI0036ADB13A
MAAPGSQGIYAATGVLFVLTNGQVSLATSGARIAEAVFGAVVGIAVNALIRPPVYLRDTCAALEDAAREAQEILEAVAEGLADGEGGTHAAGERHERALASGPPDRPGPLRDRLEPRKHAGAITAGAVRVPSPGKAYDDALTVLNHVAVHTAGVTRTVLETANHSGKAARPGPQITGPYADFLRHTARAVGLYGQSRFAGSDSHGCDSQALREVVAGLRRTLDELQRRLPDAIRDDPARRRRTARSWPRSAAWPISSSRTEVAAP